MAATLSCFALPNLFVCSFPFFFLVFFGSYMNPSSGVFLACLPLPETAVGQLNLAKNSNAALPFSQIPAPTPALVFFLRISGPVGFPLHALPSHAGFFSPFSFPFSLPQDIARRNF